MQWTPDEIRRHRVQRDWTQDEAAHAAGVSRRSWSDWENGKARPQGRNADALDRVFDSPHHEPALSAASDMQFIVDLARRFDERPIPDRDRDMQILADVVDRLAAGNADRLSPDLPTQDIDWPRRNDSDTGHTAGGGA